LRSAIEPSHTRKLRRAPSSTTEISSLPVRRHQAGKSSFTEVSVEMISSRPPRSSGSICLMLADQQQQTAAAVQIAAVETGVRRFEALRDRLHDLAAPSTA
jgi:hypothetical protein